MTGTDGLTTEGTGGEAEDRYEDDGAATEATVGIGIGRFIIAVSGGVDVIDVDVIAVGKGRLLTGGFDDVFNFSSGDLNSLVLLFSSIVI